ncbi:MAG TPA: helix-turn-helix domain-containing protein, partial [Thermodesulfobacteriota bacterium]
MGTIERRERERAATRAKILDAARELFVSEGYDAVTMRRIADRIEYTAAALYRHFPDKRALLDA